MALTRSRGNAAREKNKGMKASGAPSLSLRHRGTHNLVLNLYLFFLKCNRPEFICNNVRAGEVLAGREPFHNYRVW